MEHNKFIEECYDVIADLPVAALCTIAPKYFDRCETDVERMQVKGIFLSRARFLGSSAETAISGIFKALEKELHDREEKRKQRENLDAADDLGVWLETNTNGSPALTINNYCNILKHDPLFSSIYYNVLKNCAEIHETELGKVSVRPWTDADEAESLRYIEEKYHLYSTEKHQRALSIFLKQREYDPLLKRTESLPPWDGIPRIEMFLHKWMGVEDTPYSREVSRLIFAGGINRIYEPGCKFDAVPVLVGTKQGEGKSSIVRFLAVHDSCYAEVTQFEGKEAVEQLMGASVCEISEMLALSRAKDVECVKAFLTRQIDQYRRAYERNTSEFPRRCIFIGTTNNEHFLNDKTGNRRFFPVKCNMSGYDLFAHEQECRDYILLCWGEARDRYKAGNMPACADRNLLSEYLQAQENAMEDDWRVGAIEAYLERKRVGEKVCARQLMREALTMHDTLPRDPTKQESRDIGLIMAKMPGWIRIEYPVYINASYPNQRGWIKTEDTPGTKLLPEDEPLPF